MLRVHVSSKYINWTHTVREWRRRFAQNVHLECRIAEMRRCGTGCTPSELYHPCRSRHDLFEASVSAKHPALEMCVVRCLGMGGVHMRIPR